MQGRNFLALVVLELKPKANEFSRDVYNIIDLCGDVGGASGLLTACFAWLIIPLASHFSLL